MKSVYVMESSDGRVKIGISKDPIKRVNTLSKAGGFDICNLFFTKETACANKIEALALNEYKDFRVNGEWFCIGFADAVSFVEDNFVLKSCDDNDRDDHEERQQSSMDWELGVSVRLKAKEEKEKTMSIISLMSKVNNIEASKAAKMSDSYQYLYCITWLSNYLMSEVQLKLEI